MESIRTSVHKVGQAIHLVWRTWLRPMIATIGRGNYHVDRMG